MDIGTPPFKGFRSTSVEERKEDDNTGNGDRAIQGRAEHKVVPSPPDRLPPLDKQAKQQAHNRPTPVVCARRGRDVIETAQE